MSPPVRRSTSRISASQSSGNSASTLLTRCWRLRTSRSSAGMSRGGVASCRAGGERQHGAGGGATVRAAGRGHRFPATSSSSRSKNAAAKAARSAASRLPAAVSRRPGRSAQLDEPLAIGGVAGTVVLCPAGRRRRVVQPGADLAGEEEGPADPDRAERVELVGVEEQLRLAAHGARRPPVAVTAHAVGDPAGAARVGAEPEENLRGPWSPRLRRGRSRRRCRPPARGRCRAAAPRGRAPARPRRSRRRVAARARAPARRGRSRGCRAPRPSAAAPRDARRARAGRGARRGVTDGTGGLILRAPAESGDPPRPEVASAARRP